MAWSSSSFSERKYSSIILPIGVVRSAWIPTFKHMKVRMTLADSVEKMLTREPNTFRRELGFLQAAQERFGLCTLARSIKTFDNNEGAALGHV